MSSSLKEYLSNNLHYSNELIDSLNSIDYFPGNNIQNQVENNTENQNNNNQNVNPENKSEKQKWFNFGEGEGGNNIGVRDGDEFGEN